MIISLESNKLKQYYVQRNIGKSHTGNIDR